MYVHIYIHPYLYIQVYISKKKVSYVLVAYFKKQNFHIL